MYVPQSNGVLEAKVRDYSGKFDVVTGAFGYTGKHIASKLLDSGHQVKTITRHVQQSHVLEDRVHILPYFDRSTELTESLIGVDTVYNTHWTRFNRGGSSFGKAIRNTEVLLKAAEQAGARKFVHISVSNAERQQRFPYFRGKHEVEDMVRYSRLSYSILRPALIFGPEEILINNIYFFIKRFHAFAIPGDGNYRIQPIHVDDLAEMAIESAQGNGSIEFDVAGPEDFTFNELIGLLKRESGTFSIVFHAHPSVALFFADMIGKMLHDVVLTEDEMHSLMEGLLESRNPTRGSKSFSSWLREEGHNLGEIYAHELRRNYT